MGKFLIITGLIILLAGIAIHFSDKIPFLGKLPGDIHIRRDNFTFYFPLTTSILLSILVSVILYFITKGKN
jgi:thiosulfate reductase cytochrome b subunit